MTKVTDLNAYRRSRRRRAVLRGIAAYSLTAALLIPGALTTIVFLVLDRFGAIDWSPIWLWLPLMIDAALWLAVLRSHIVNDWRYVDEDDFDDSA